MRDRNGLYGTGMVCSGPGWYGAELVSTVQDRVGQYRTELVSTGQGWSVRLSVGQYSTYRRGFVIRGQVWTLRERFISMGLVGQNGTGWSVRYGRELVSMKRG